MAGEGQNSMRAAGRPSERVWPGVRPRAESVTGIAEAHDSRGRQMDRGAEKEGKQRKERWERRASRFVAHMPTKKAGQLPGEAELLGQLLGIAVVRGRSSWVVVPVVPSAAARRNPGRSAEAQPPPAARETWTLSRPSAARGQQTWWDGDPAGCACVRWCG